jgi:hypothetical protein
MSLTYNMNHLQIAEVGATPVYIDIDGAISMAPTITEETTDVRGDGVVWATLRGARTGEVSMTWLKTSFAVQAAANGGIVSSSGTTPNAIERYEIPGSGVSPAVIVSSWEPNAAPDKSPDEAGLRTTIPNASFGIANKASGQETVGEWSATGTFKPDENDAMLIYELMESEPVFTLGVMTVNLEAPGP